MTGTILTMAITGFATAVSEKILIASGKTEMASLINIGGLSLLGVETCVLVGKVFGSLRTIAGA